MKYDISEQLMSKIENEEKTKEEEEALDKLQEMNLEKYNQAINNTINSIMEGKING